MNSNINISEALREWIYNTLLFVPREEELSEVPSGWDYSDCDVRLKIFNADEGVVLFYWKRVLLTFDGIHKGRIGLNHLSEEQINEIDEELVNSDSLEEFLTTVSHYLPSQ